MQFNIKVSNSENSENIAFIINIVSEFKFLNYTELKVSDGSGKLIIKLDNEKYKNKFNVDEFKMFVQKVKSIQSLENKYPDRLINRTDILKLLKINKIDIYALNNLHVGVYEVVNDDIGKKFFVSHSGDVSSEFRYLNFIENKRVFFTISVKKTSGVETIEKIKIEKIESCLG